MQGLKARTLWVSVLALALTSCVTLDKLLHFAVDHFPLGKAGTTPQRVGMLTEVNELVFVLKNNIS